MWYSQTIPVTASLVRFPQRRCPSCYMLHDVVPCSLALLQPHQLYNTSRPQTYSRVPLQATSVFYFAGVVPNSAACQIMHPLVLVGLGVGVGKGVGLGVGLGLGNRVRFQRGDA